MTLELEEHEFLWRIVGRDGLYFEPWEATEFSATIRFMSKRASCPTSALRLEKMINGEWEGWGNE